MLSTSLDLDFLSAELGLVPKNDGRKRPMSFGWFSGGKERFGFDSSSEHVYFRINTHTTVIALKLFFYFFFRPYRKLPQNLLTEQ